MYFEFIVRRASSIKIVLLYAYLPQCQICRKKSFLLTNYIVCGLSLYKVVKIGYERLATSSIDLLGPRKLRES